ncbi:hypothetical protein CR205_13045 [Alteribacter lacisalsi]|uniref:Uncharacterized protein n=1 Tax=Alteribacter lacisalsi TaxID=2045244 RepID=A0A2W0HGS7_9BACI|nr:hypothetical protein [Alteribacter lacisalsi]PYZ96625.1 hypothetical protein CR205_13045 [Alteribacter lacisalsi]
MLKEEVEFNEERMIDCIGESIAYRQVSYENTDEIYFITGGGERRLVELGNRYKLVEATDVFDSFRFLVLVYDGINEDPTLYYEVQFETFYELLTMHLAQNKYYDLWEVLEELTGPDQDDYEGRQKALEEKVERMMKMEKERGK